MSGPICAECGGTYLENVHDANCKTMIQCKVCGWKGDETKQMNVWLTDEGYEQSRKDYELKQRGKLFFVRVWISAQSKDEATRAVYDVIAIFRLHGASTAGTGEKRTMRMRMSDKPTDEQIQKIKAVPGVTKVTVF